LHTQRIHLQPDRFEEDDGQVKGARRGYDGKIVFELILAGGWWEHLKTGGHARPRARETFEIHRAIGVQSGVNPTARKAPRCLGGPAGEGGERQ